MTDLLIGLHSHAVTMFKLKKKDQDTRNIFPAKRSQQKVTKKNFTKINKLNITLTKLYYTPYTINQQPM